MDTTEAEVTTTIYSTRAWRAARLAVLERDSYRCMIALPGCRGVATQVDHITPLAAGGAPFDPQNMRAACIKCNASLGASFGNAKREPRSEDW